MDDLEARLLGLPELLKKALDERNNLLSTVRILKEEQEQEFVSRQPQQAIYNKDNALKQTLEDTKTELLKTRQELWKTQKELDETKNRLSKLMGHKLYDGNSDIADLSDPKRPSKIAEFYSELYDNQWTDAFELLHDGGDEKKTVNKLMQILVDAHKFCEQLVAKQMSQVINVLTLSEKGERVASSREKKLVKELRKVMVDKASKEVFKKYMEDLEEYGSEGVKNVKKVRAFAEECIKIGWYMAVQDPPVVFASVPRKGEMFDKDMYAAYTRAGSRIDYVVWPALLLCEDGKVMRKGVAQGNGDNARPISAHDVRPEWESDNIRPTSSYGWSGSSNYSQIYARDSGPSWNKYYDEPKRSQCRGHDFKGSYVKPSRHYSQSVSSKSYSDRTYPSY